MLVKRFIASVTSLAVVTGGMPAFGSLTAAGLPPRPALQGGSSRLPITTADGVAGLLEAAAKDIPRDTFDPTAVVTAVGKDRAALLAWVTNQTYWVPYRGALRGPAGVLMDRLGSSLDRSLLLAELLTLAGHTVRLAQGTLSDQGAREALQRMRPVPANPVPSAMVDDVAVQRHARQFGVDLLGAKPGAQVDLQALEAMKSSLGNRVKAQAPFLAGQVGAARPTSDRSGGALAALRDHWWVQVRDANQWSDLDPMWPAARTVAGGYSPARTIPYEKAGTGLPLPADQVHQVSVRVVIEQWKHGKVAEKRPLDHTFRPAESQSLPIVLQVAGLGWPKTSDILKEADPAAALRVILEKRTEWLPSITIGDRTIRQSSFSETGELNTKPGQPLAAAAAAAAASIGDAFSGGDVEPEGQLTAAWLEFEIRAPGRPAVKVRRDLFDVFSQQARLREALPDPAFDATKRAARGLALATAMQLLPVVSRPSRQYVATQVIAGMLKNRDVRMDMVRRAAAGDIGGAIGRADSLKLTLNGELLDLATGRFEWSPAGQDVYLDAPNLLSHRTTLFKDGSGRLAVRAGFDIITNGMAVRPGAAGDAFEISLTQGIVDTNLEDLLMRRPTAGNAGALLSASAQQPWVILRGLNDATWSQLKLPSDVRARIEDQLRLGYVVVAPGAAAVAAGKGQVAWWRIDPRTGETLGFGPLGWGQSLVEYAAMFVFSTLLIFAICMIVQSGPQQTSAQLSRSLGQCACLGSQGGFAITAAFAGELAIALFVAAHGAVFCWYMYPPTTSALAQPIPPNRLAPGCGPIPAGDQAVAVPVPPWRYACQRRTGLCPVIPS